VSANFSITGDRELDKKLATLAPRVQKRVVKKAAGYAARRARKSVREDVPVDEGVLKKSIGTVTRTYRNAVIVVVGPRKSFVAASGERADKYMIGIERGWRGRVPNPIVRRAYEAGKATVMADFQIGIGNGIEKEAMKSG